MPHSVSNPALADLKNKITQGLLCAEIDPIPHGMVDDLLTIARRWHRRKLQADRGELKKAQQQENLRLAYAAIQSRKRGGDSLQNARLALHGAQDGQRRMNQTAYKKAKVEVRNIKAGRHLDYAFQYLLNSLCDVYEKHLGRLPPCGWREDKGWYSGDGLRYVDEMLHVITGNSLALNTIGKYLVKEKYRINKIYKG